MSGVKCSRPQWRISNLAPVRCISGTSCRAGCHDFNEISDGEMQQGIYMSDSKMPRPAAVFLRQTHSCINV